MAVNKIKFSHDYPKLHGQIAAQLLKVETHDKSELNKDFIEYDTRYSSGYYELPTGKLIILVFLGDKLIPFTTVRPWKPAYGGMQDKETFYRSKIGQLFEIEISEE